MGKFPEEKMWRAVLYLACPVLLLIRLDEFGSSEFSGGWLTGLLFRMAELLFFLAAFALDPFLRRFRPRLRLQTRYCAFRFTYTH
jgi:hypothetical protein